MWGEGVGHRIWHPHGPRHWWGGMLDVTTLTWFVRGKKEMGETEKEKTQRERQRLRDTERKEKHSMVCWHTDSQRKKRP